LGPKNVNNEATFRASSVQQIILPIRVRLKRETIGAYHSAKSQITCGRKKRYLYEYDTAATYVSTLR
jgi:hypothetical protein